MHLTRRKKYILTICFYGFTSLFSGCAYNQYMDEARGEKEVLEKDLKIAERTQHISERDQRTLLQRKARLEAEIKKEQNELRRLEQKLQQELRKIETKQREANQFDRLAVKIQEEKAKVRQKMDARITAKIAEIKEKKKDLEALSELIY